MSTLIPTHELIKPSIEIALTISTVFRDFLVEISHHYPPESITKFLEWHSTESLEEKFNDPERFFRIIK
jgi:hypothetical protein